MNSYVHTKFNHNLVNSISSFSEKYWNLHWGSGLNEWSGLPFVPKYMNGSRMTMITVQWKRPRSDLDLVSTTKTHVSHLLWSCKILVLQVFCVVFIWSHILRNVHSGEVWVHFLRISWNNFFFYCCWFELVIRARAISQWAACWLMP
jgi:hypothetical protein